MKKALSLILALCMLLAFAGCGDKRPAAKDALDAILKDPVAAMSLLQNAGSADSEEYLSEDDLCKAMLAGMTYSIKSAEENGDTAVVTAEITNADAAKIIPQFFTDLFTFALEQAFSSDPMSEEEQEAHCMDLLTTLYADKDQKKVTKTVNVSMNYADDKWSVENTEDLADAMLGGFITSIGTIGDDFGDFGDFGSSYEDSPFNVEYVLADETLVDDDSCVIRVTNVTFNTDWNDIDFSIYCENKTDDVTLDFSLDSLTVCGYSINSFWYETVAPGKKSNTDFSVSVNDLEKAAIASLDEVTMTLIVKDADDWFADPILEEACTLYPTGLNADSVFYPARRTVDGEQVILDNEYCTLIMLDTDEDTFWGPSINCYVENKTVESIYISMNDVSVNGFMMEPYWGVTLGAGAKAYSAISFSSDDLEANGITEMETIEFELYAHNNDTWEDYFRVGCVYNP